MARAKTEEAKEFYLLLTQKNNYSARELDRQIDSMLFERMMISMEVFYIWLRLKRAANRQNLW